MLRRFSIASKAALTALPTSLAVAVLHLAGLAWIVRGVLPDVWEMGRPTWAFAGLVAAAVLLAFGAACAITYAWVGAFARDRTAHISAVLERIARGEMRGPVGRAIDSDLLVVEEALERMQGALDALTSRLRRVDAQRRRLFSDLVHELATPTGTIVAIADGLMHVIGDESQHAQQLAFLVQETSRLGRLVGDMRDLARLDDPDLALARARLDVGDLARSMEERLAKPDTARVRVEASEAWAEVDRDRLEQVITNLVANARRYAPKSGCIAIAVVSREAEVEILVDDDGPGVPDEMLPRLGERLLRIDPSRSQRTGGHGLGLSIVRAVVERHGGRVTFARAPIGGLRVAIRLPGSR